MKQEHIKSYYTINGLCLFIVCVTLTSDKNKTKIKIMKKILGVKRPLKLGVKRPGCETTGNLFLKNVIFV